MAEQFANVDTVYQTVLALANKEQRGYITPQEFNLFARQAQMEIFEQYFYDLNQIKRGIQGTHSDFSSNLKEIVENKLSKFLKTAYLPATDQNGTSHTLPLDVYKESNVNLWSKHRGYKVQKSNKADADVIVGSGYLTRPNFKRSIYYVMGDRLFVYPVVSSYGTIATGMPQNEGQYAVHYTYFSKPEDPNWTYLVINEKAIWYEHESTRHFALDKSEERNLVMKILQYAGVSIKQFDLVQAAGQAEANTTAQQKQ